MRRIAIVFYAIVRWGNNISVDDRNRIEMRVKKVGSMNGRPLDSLACVMEVRTRRKVICPVITTGQTPIEGSRQSDCPCSS